MPALYIADGHHRSAAAALVGAEKANQNLAHRGDEEYNYFMAVCFPASQLTIIDYNRVVKDLNGLTEEEFLAALQKNFEVQKMGAEIYKPAGLHNFALYLGGNWYSLTARPGTYNDNDPIGVLDVTISSNLILDEILGIKDLRSDKRIDFVGGIRGLGELKRRVDSGEMKVALALYPVSMKQLMDIADTGNIMPPKTTWFEPKLRSGLVIHKLDVFLYVQAVLLFYEKGRLLLLVVSLLSSPKFPEGYSSGCGYIERVYGMRHGDAYHIVGFGYGFFRQTIAFGAHYYGELWLCGK